MSSCPSSVQNTPRITAEERFHIPPRQVIEFGMQLDFVEAHAGEGLYVWGFARSSGARGP